MQTEKTGIPENAPSLSADDMIFAARGVRFSWLSVKWLVCPD